MKNHLRQALENRFIRSVAIVATGAAGAQAITIIFMPIVTRIYSPEVIGVAGTFTAVLAMILPLATLSYPSAIVLPKKDSEAVALVKLSIGAALLASLATVIALFFFKDPLARIIGLQTEEALILFIPAAMMLSSVLSTANQWIIRRKLYKINAKISIIQATLLNTAKVAIGTIAPTAPALVAVTVIGNAVHSAMLFAGIRLEKKNMEREVEPPTDALANCKQTAARYRDFPCYKAPEVALSEASQSLPIILLTLLFGAASAGHYVLGRMVLSAPSSLIGSAVGDVIFPKIAESYNNNEPITRTITRSTFSLLAIGAIPFGTVFLVGPQLFTIIFGDDWLKAGEYARWISIWLLFMFANPPATKALTVLGAQKVQLVISIATILIRAISLFAGYAIFKDEMIAIAFFGVSSAIINIILIATAFRKCLAHERMITTGINPCRA